MSAKQFDLFTDFIQTFHKHLNESQRWEPFKFIAHNLLLRDRPIYIAETGCIREKGNWMGDGQSTLLWDWLLEKKDGAGICVDISDDACSLACDLTEVMVPICSNSINVLAEHRIVEKLDLLFLDSFDYQPPYALSELHHAAELGAAWHRLPSGCLIAVDDCHGTHEGKHTIVKAFFDRMGIPARFVGYITVWEKP